MIQAWGSLAGWLVPVFVAAVLLHGLWHRVDLIGEFVAGAREGLELSLNLFPYLLAIYVAVAAFRMSGALDLLSTLLAPVLRPLGVPAALLPLLLVRPLSGSASSGLVLSLLHQHGPDSFIGHLVSTIQGSSETTLYVLTVYLGSVGVRRSRYALPLCLSVDAIGYAAAIFVAGRLWH
jgi:spore maturation protein B